MSIFTPFFFLPLKYARFLERTGLAAEYPTRTAYDYWLLHFCREAIAFHTAQRIRHLTMIERRFYEAHGIYDGDPINDYLLDVYQRWLRNFEYPAHQSQADEINHALSAITQQVRQRIPDTGTGFEGSLTSVRGRMQREHEAYGQIGHTLRSLNGIWFDAIIANDPTSEEYLRALPYAEYLQSSHWLKVRSAMLLLTHARCQAADCWRTGDSWYGGDWEADLDIHHLSYEHRGNERYDELVALCKRHHRVWHERDDASDDPLPLIQRY